MLIFLQLSLPKNNPYPDPRRIQNVDPMRMYRNQGFRVLGDETTNGSPKKMHPCFYIGNPWGMGKFHALDALGDLGICTSIPNKCHSSKISTAGS